MSRPAMLAKVHLAKKQLGLDDDSYRAVIRRAVDKHSAGDCSDRQLVVLLAEFKRLGFSEKKHARPLSARPEIRMIYGIWKDVRGMLEGDAGDRELRAFVRRQTGQEAPEFLDAAGATRVIEGLKGWRDRLRAEQAAAGHEVAP